LFAINFQVFEFGEDLLDRIEVGTVGRQEQQMRSSGADGIAGGLAFVTAEIVENDYLARCEGGRPVIGVPSQADKAETVGVPSVSSVHYAARKTTPSETMPSRTSRHRAIISLRAKATIMGFRVPRGFSVRDRNHFVKALFFRCRRNRHAN
jgi:hypothetical protein